MGEGAIRAFETEGADYPKIISGDTSIGYYRKWAENFGDNPAGGCGVPFPPSTGYNAVQIVARILNGMELDESKLQPNPMNEGLVNTVFMNAPYIVTYEAATGDEKWLEGIDLSTTELISLDEALKLSEGMADTAVLDKYLTAEQLDSFFK
jgi:hypothetical protein